MFIYWPWPVFLPSTMTVTHKLIKILSGHKVSLRAYKKWKAPWHKGHNFWTKLVTGNSHCHAQQGNRLSIVVKFHQTPTNRGRRRCICKNFGRTDRQEQHLMPAMKWRGHKNVHTVNFSHIRNLKLDKCTININLPILLVLNCEKENGLDMK